MIFLILIESCDPKIHIVIAQIYLSFSQRVSFIFGTLKGFLELCNSPNY